jgi:hypothetical protein
MKSKSELFNKIFLQSIQDYHVKDDVSSPENNPYESNTIEYLLYKKNWIDTVQWHLEDIIRAPEINPAEALLIKRKIDLSNQNRTDLVENIDDYFFDQFKEVVYEKNARLNTETPAWAIDRLSILALKIYHFREETLRKDSTLQHKIKCQQKLDVLLLQQQNLSEAIDGLLQDIQKGICIIKTFKQMKMYNDNELNPVLRKSS